MLDFRRLGHGLGAIWGVDGEPFGPSEDTLGEKNEKNDFKKEALKIGLRVRFSNCDTLRQMRVSGP